MADRTVDPRLVAAARTRVTAFTEQLRSGIDGVAPVPNLDWTVSDLAQHVACLPDFWSNQHHAGDHFELPDDFAVYSDQARAHITEDDPVALADLIERSMSDYLDEIESKPRDRWLYGKKTTPTNMCGSIISECVLHGRDLAAVTGAPRPTFTRDEALVAVDAMVVITPIFIDAVKAASQPDGVYGVHFRGGRDFTWTKTGDSLEISPGRPAKADARLNADPAAFVMASLGRMSDARAALTGKMFVYGRRPWRFVSLGSLAIDGV